MTQLEDLELRFNHYPPRDAATVERHERVRAVLLRAALQLDDALPECREKSLFLTHLEQSMMWANAAIARWPGAVVPKRPIQDRPQA
jgi:hypothetical protein